MGIYRKLVEGSNSVNSGATTEPSDRLLTIPNAMTVARPTILSGIVCKKLINGEKGVTKWMLATGGSDGEGFVGRIWDKFFPNSGRGTTEFGAWADPIADSSALIEIAGAALIAPRVSTLGKLAILVACGHEAYKAAWAIGKNQEYKQAGGGRLSIKPTIEGKESMVEKFMAVGLAVSTNDIDNPKLKTAVGFAALGHALVGSARAEGQRRHHYVPLANNLINMQASGRFDEIDQAVAQLEEALAAEAYASSNPTMTEWY